MWVAAPEVQTKWLLLFASQDLHDSLVLRGSRNVFTPDLVWSLSTLTSSQPSMFLAVSIVPGGTGSKPLLPTLWNHVNSPYHSSHTRKPSWEHQLLIWCKRNCIEFLFATASSFLPLLRVTERLWSPTTSPFQKLSSFFRILSHPSTCFPHSPISSFDSKAQDSLWSICYGDQQRTIKTQRGQLILH